MRILSPIDPKCLNFMRLESLRMISAGPEIDGRDSKKSSWVSLCRTSCQLVIHIMSTMVRSIQPIAHAAATASVARRCLATTANSIVIPGLGREVDGFVGAVG